MVRVNPASSIDRAGRIPADIAEALVESVLVLDGELRVRYLNAAAEDLLGVSRRRALGARLAELVRVEPDWVAHVRAAVAGGEAFTAREIALGPAHDGDLRHVDASVTPWQAAEWGAVALIELVTVDRHLRIARDEALRAQDQANRSLLRGLAHEVRNPLGGLRGAAQLLHRQLGDGGLAEYAQVIIREADRLRDLVDRMVGPVRPPALADVNVHEVTEHVVRLLRAEANGAVEIVTEYDPSIPDLRADRDQLVQALLNLGRNAMQAVGARGHVRVATRALRRFTIGQTLHRLVVCVEIADDGPGIPPELADTLFQPMVSGRADGSGLGLTLSQSLVRRHDGLIECESRPGATVFRVLLPLEGPASE